MAKSTKDDDKPTKKKKKKKVAPAESSSGSTVKFKGERAVATVVEEKPHKGSVSKAKKKVAKLREEIPESIEVEVMDAMSTASSQEKQHLEEYLHMFKRLRKLIRKAEKTCLTEGSNSREYYALCALYSQQREIIADIRSVSDMSGQVASMDANVIRPLISSTGQNVLDSMFQIRKIIIECSAKDKTQDALHKLELITNEQGKFLQGQYASSIEKVSSILLG